MSFPGAQGLGITPPSSERLGPTTPWRFSNPDRIGEFARGGQQQNRDSADPGGVTAPSGLPGQAGREVAELF